MEYYYNGLFANLSTFSPIPELNRSTGDGTLCFISSNAILFVEPCDDPVFAAHVPHYDGTDDLTYYLGDRVTGVLGCLEQVRDTSYRIWSLNFANNTFSNSTNGVTLPTKSVPSSEVWQTPKMK